MCIDPNVQASWDVINSLAVGMTIKERIVRLM